MEGGTSNIKRFGVNEAVVLTFIGTLLDTNLQSLISLTILG